MTQKKSKGEIPADMWLHVATDALAKYGDGGGEITAWDMALEESGEERLGLILFLPGVSMADPRLAPAFSSSKAIVLGQEKLM